MKNSYKTLQVQRKRYKNLPSKIKTQLRSLNHRELGYMRDELKDDGAWIYLIIHKELVIAWAIVIQIYTNRVQGNSNSYESMFYTRQSHRKQGLAHKIASRIRRDYSRSYISFPITANINLS